MVTVREHDGGVRQHHLMEDPRGVLWLALGPRRGVLSLLLLELGWQLLDADPNERTTLEAKGFAVGQFSASA